MFASKVVGKSFHLKLKAAWFRTLGFFGALGVVSCTSEECVNLDGGLSSQYDFQCGFWSSIVKSTSLLSIRSMHTLGFIFSWLHQKPYVKNQ